MYRATQTLVAVLVASAVLAGCGTRRTTDTPRTASEQLLVSAAVDQAVGQLDFSPLADRKTFVDASHLDRVDKEYVISAIRWYAWQAGARMVDAADDADYVLEIRSGAVGVDRSEYILGIPASQLPTPAGVSAPVPEAAIFKSIKQVGASRISFLVYRRDDRRFFYASGPTYGFSDQRNWWILGAGPVVKDNVQPTRATDNTATVPETVDRPSNSPTAQPPDQAP